MVVYIFATVLRNSVQIAYACFVFCSLLLTMFHRVLARGSRLLCLWMSNQGVAAAAGSTGSRKRIPTERIILQVVVSSYCSRSINICSVF